MTFSQEVKEELSKLNNLANKEELKYEFLGYMSSDNTIIENKAIKYTTENDYNIDRFGKVIRNIGFEEFDINVNGKIFSIEINENLIDILTKIRTSRLEYFKFRKYWKNQIASIYERAVYGSWFNK
mgnify:CR=1 FL=1